MNEAKQRSLLKAARRAVPTIPADFSSKVVAAVRRESEAVHPPSIFESLAALFPRAAVAVVVVITLCVAAEWYLERASDYAEVTQEWFFDVQ